MQPIQCRKDFKVPRFSPFLWGTLCSQSGGKPMPLSKVQQPATEAPSSQTHIDSAILSAQRARQALGITPAGWQ
eukprot:s5291_g1.t1